MTSGRQLKELRGSAAHRALDSCYRDMISGRVSSRQVRTALRCEPTPQMEAFDRFLIHRDPVVRGSAAKVLAKWRPSKVVPAILAEENRTALGMMLDAIKDSGYREVGDLTPLLRNEDGTLVEEAMQMFVAVGRADLLFGMVLSGDETTVERVRRYLDEQEWL